MRGIRVMALEDTFQTRFADDLNTTLRSGNVAAWGTGIGNGTGTALPYFVQGQSTAVTVVGTANGSFPWQHC